MLAPYLTPENAEALLQAAARHTKSEIEELLAQRFPRSETMALVQTLPASALEGGEPMTPGHVAARGVRDLPCQLAPAQVTPHSKVAPVAPERFLLQFTVGRSTRDKLRYAQELLGHELPSADLALVLDQAVDALIERLEKRKFAATRRPSRSGRPSTHPRHIPAHVRRTVWERDGGQCTFVSEAGRRCTARTQLEFDHVVEVARGGEATAENLRLRCRGHNQYVAECTFGTAFMDGKRQEARDAALARAALRPVAARAPQHAPGRVAPAEVEASEECDVVPWLRRLGFNAGEARRAAALCHTLPDASFEERLRLALDPLETSAPPRREPPGGGNLKRRACPLRSRLGRSAAYASPHCSRSPSSSPSRCPTSC